MKQASLRIVAVAVASLLAAAFPSERGVADAAALPGDDAVVLGTGGSGLRLRSGPGVSYGIVGAMPEGTRVVILDGPQSDGEYTWYQVEATNALGPRWNGWGVGTYLVPPEYVQQSTDGQVDTHSFQAQVTGYASGGGVGYLTSTGTQVHWGTVSVDPAVIPLGSRLLIEGLEGIFTAEDTGSAVRGVVLEVWFPDAESALRWGNQRRRVTILQRGG